MPANPHILLLVSKNILVPQNIVVAQNIMVINPRTGRGAYHGAK